MQRLEQTDPKQQYWLGTACLESHAAETGVGSQWTRAMGQQCAPAATKANQTLGCINKSTASPVRLNPEHNAPFGAPNRETPNNREIDKLQSPAMGTINMPEIRLKFVHDIFTHDSKSIYKSYLPNMKYYGRSFTVPSDRTRGNEHKLKHRRNRLNIRKHFITVTVTKH
ncbi:hypothetical protein QYF61_025717 [Mycteria americana]|uniref:Uncharacterized protein n=1 Tax=Mycteria americana TaxID=33587 RepID=A0AAN7SBF6_MYCAM|nr:hypothetical protein QYF61_025717 [Mycteria americana]